MEQVIRYYLRKLDNANDLMGMTFTHKLIQLEHQPTIENALDGLKSVQYPRHFPNHLVVQLARLNRPEVNECLIDYFEQNYTASNTRWQAMAILQDDRVVQTVVNAIEGYGHSYFSRKIVNRHIALLGDIATHGAYLALRDIIEDYFRTDNRFIDNYEIPLASVALEALAKIDLPEAITYRQQAEAIYCQRIEDELMTYPRRFEKERTSIGINLHEGSALARMRQYALPTVVKWHQVSPGESMREFALRTMLNTLKVYAGQPDEYTRPAIRYLISIFDELAERGLINTGLEILKNAKDECITDFAWRAFDAEIESTLALKVLSRHNPDAVYEGVLYHFQHHLNVYDMRRTNGVLIRAYIEYFGQVSLPGAMDILIDLYRADLSEHDRYIAEALIPHAGRHDRALRLLDEIIQDNQDSQTITQTISALPQLGDKAFLILLSLLHCDTLRRNHAIEALGTLRNPQAIPHLLDMLLLAHDDAELEEVTIRALVRIGTESAFIALNAWDENQPEQ